MLALLFYANPKYKLTLPWKSALHIANNKNKNNSWQKEKGP